MNPEMFDLRYKINESRNWLKASQPSNLNCPAL
jgi:hypothetical protein